MQERMRLHLHNTVFFIDRIVDCEPYNMLSNYCHSIYPEAVLMRSLDLCPNLHLIRASILCLKTAIPYEVQQKIEVLLFIYWLAHAASYKVITSAFDIL